MSRKLSAKELRYAHKLVSVKEWGESQNLKFTKSQCRVVENMILRGMNAYKKGRWKRFTTPNKWVLVFEAGYVKSTWRMLGGSKRKADCMFADTCRRFAVHTPFAKHWYVETFKEYCANEDISFRDLCGRCYFGLFNMLANDDFHEASLERQFGDKINQVVEVALWPPWMFAVTDGVKEQPLARTKK